MRLSNTSWTHTVYENLTDEGESPEHSIWENEMVHAHPLQSYNKLVLTILPEVLFWLHNPRRTLGWLPVEANVWSSLDNSLV